MEYGLILSDSWSQDNDIRHGVGRSYYAHTMANFLRQHNYNIDVVDFLHNFSIDDLTKIFNVIATNEPKFVCISVTLDKKYKYWNELVYLIKQTIPTTKIIVFGERVLRTDYNGADYYIEGQSETAVLAILESSNISYVNHNKFKLINATQDYFHNMQSSPVSLKYIESDFVNSAEVQPIMFSKGCIFTCAFCNHTDIGVKKKISEKSRETIKAEMLHAYHNYGIKKFSIIDSTFNDTQEKVDLLFEIAQEIPDKLEIVCFMRLDILHKQPGLLDKAVQAGVVAIHFGLDSFNEETVKIINKTGTSESLKQYLVDIKNQYPDLFIYGTFICGLPADTVENQYATSNWAMNSNALDMWYWFPLSIKRNIINGEVLSPIDKDFTKFGYKEEFKNIDLTNVGRGQRDKNLEVVAWKNEYMNLSDAIILSDKLNKLAYLRNKFNPWKFFRISTVYKNINWWLKFYPAKSAEDIFPDIADRTTEFIDNYKQNKLNYFNSLSTAR